MDSNNDGIGDINGIISRLDHIKETGFETIWFSPLYAGPQQDFGYDISDYCAIAPEYGTMKDAERLIAEAHRRGLKVVFDMVLDHTSDQHPWFLESRSGRNSPRRDWYLWRTGRGNRPPNNWKCITGSSGWQYDGGTGEWYFANFLKFQPDLNLRNPQVKKTMFDICRYWFRKGVDGFRLDLFHAVFKDAEFRDNPRSCRYLSPDLYDMFFQKKKYTMNLPENFEFARDLRRVADEFSPERYLLGEVFGDIGVKRRYLGDHGEGIHQIFLFELLRVRATARFFRGIIGRYEELYPAPVLPTYVYGNHDQSRTLTKVGHDLRKARLLALVQFTVRGVPVTYYGEEIGMRDARIPPRHALDPQGRKYSLVPKWAGDLAGFCINRDNCRTPMQWDEGPNGGFNDGSAAPWLPVNGDYRTVNVSRQRGDPGSLLATYRDLLGVRKSHGALHSGDLQLMGDTDLPADLLAYRRTFGDEALAVLVNFGKRELRVPGLRCGGILYSTDSGNMSRNGEVRLGPLSGMILEG
ncbi:MAG: DUF3459 domain-containing protein [Spirochaetes bacterium]|nr:DUF3459 domain-containing protein [Spirochaetota bacterium]